MKKLLSLLFITGTILHAEERTVDRVFQQGTNTYLISFKFDPLICWTPAIIGPTQSHYPALATVYKTGNGQAIKIGEPIRCDFTDKGCFEDNSEMLVGKALGKKP